LRKVKGNIKGVDKVKCVHLQTLQRKLEALQMKPLKSISEFHTQIIMVQYQIKRNGENFEYMRISENILRPLDLKSCYSVSLAEIKDLEAILIEELMGSLQTHEQKINRRSNDKILEQALQLKLSLTKKRYKQRGASYQ
jgi:hypothetical protein